MEWIKVDKDTPFTMVEDTDLWVYNDITDEVEFFGCDDFVPLGKYSHYQVANKPSRPNTE